MLDRSPKGDTFHRLVDAKLAHSWSASLGVTRVESTSLRSATKRKQKPIETKHPSWISKVWTELGGGPLSLAVCVILWHQATSCNLWRSDTYGMWMEQWRRYSATIPGKYYNLSVVFCVSFIKFTKNNKNNNTFLCLFVVVRVFSCCLHIPECQGAVCFEGLAIVAAHCSVIW